MHTDTTISIPVVIAGITPLLCCRPDEPLVGATPRQQAAARLYLDEQGNPAIPAANLLRCFCGAGRHLNLQPRSLGSLLGLTRTWIPIRSQGDWQVDSRSVRMPGSYARSILYRPSFEAWSLAFDLLLLDPDRMQPETVASLIRAAGQYCGLGDFRAEQGGPFGRFRLVMWGQP